MRSSSGTDGWVLLELLVALCLFGLAVAPLWTLLASQRESAVQLAHAASDEPVDAEQGPDGLAWTWGTPQVRAVRWEPGGALTVRIDGSRNVASMLVGVWLDGSFMGETEARSGEWTSFEAVLRHPLPPLAPVVVRARIPAGPWGVPWRTEVPGIAAPPSSGESAADAPVGWVTVHLPAAGDCDTQFRDPLRTTTVPISLDGPSDLVAVPSGPISVVTAGRTQDYMVETSQHVDLYF